MDTPNNLAPTDTSAQNAPPDPPVTPIQSVPNSDAKPIEELPPALSPDDLTPPPKMVPAMPAPAASLQETQTPPPPPAGHNPGAVSSIPENPPQTQNSTPGAGAEPKPNEQEQKPTIAPVTTLAPALSPDIHTNKGDELPPATSPDDLMVKEPEATPKVQMPQIEEVKTGQDMASPQQTPIAESGANPPVAPAKQSPRAAPPVPAGFKPPEAPTGQSLRTPPAGVPPPPGPKIPKGAIIKRAGGSSLAKIILAVLAFLVIAGAVFFFFFYRVTLNMNLPVKPDQILLDSKIIKEGSIKIMPGNHSLVVSKQGYISYRISKKFAIGEKLNLTFELKPQAEPQVIAQGAKMISASFDQKFVNFVTSDNHLAAVPVTSASEKSTPTILSVGAFNGLRQALFSQSNTFALVLDAEALKLIDLKKTDILDQTIAKLPPDPTRISSVSWNVTQSQFVSEPNAKIIYDLKADNLWNIILANRTHSQSEILMEVQKGEFSNLYLDWGQSAKNILVAGGELGVIDISSRTYQTIDKDKDIHFASWGPNGTYALALAKDNTVYILKDGSRLESLNLKTTPGQITFISAKEGLIVSDGRPSRINFDTGEVTSYAEIKGLDGAKSIAVAGGNLYFADQEGLKTAALTENVYNQ